MILILNRILNAIFPSLILTRVTLTGLLPAFKSQFSSPSLFKLLSPRYWWTLIFAGGFPSTLEDIDKLWRAEKREVISHAYGNILEIGPGAGHSIAYYEHKKVTKIVGIEPFEAIHHHTRVAIERAKLTEKYDLVAASIEDSDILADHGVLPGSMDTIMCVQVLCSIPNPKQVIAEMYKLLKPGGQLLVFEHVLSKDEITRCLQKMWTHGGWHALTGKGCTTVNVYTLNVSQVAIWTGLLEIGFVKRVNGLPLSFNLVPRKPGQTSPLTHLAVLSKLNKNNKC
jgi:SAM-dependent methyltransferase